MHASYDVPQGKMPNVITGTAYSKEYKGDDSAGQDALCVQRSAATSGQRVVLVDDLVATGGTLLAGVDLVKGLVRLARRIAGCQLVSGVYASNCVVFIGILCSSRCCSANARDL